MTSSMAHEKGNSHVGRLSPVGSEGFVMCSVGRFSWKREVDQQADPWVCSDVSKSGSLPGTTVLSIRLPALVAQHPPRAAREACVCEPSLWAPSACGGRGPDLHTGLQLHFDWFGCY